MEIIHVALLSVCMIGDRVDLTNSTSLWSSSYSVFLLLQKLCTLYRRLQISRTKQCRKL